MDKQRLSIRGRILESDDPALQDALAIVYGAPERRRCLCVPGGIEKYVASRGRYLAKRMPETGSQHHPACPSFEPSPQQSGLGELVGDAVVESEGAVELRVDFAWSRQARGRAPVGRSEDVLHRYLLRAADQVRAKGVALGEGPYVPEQFNEATRAEAAERRRGRLGVLRPHHGLAPLAVVLAEFKAAEIRPIAQEAPCRTECQGNALISRAQGGAGMGLHDLVNPAQDAVRVNAACRRLGVGITAVCRACAVPTQHSAAASADRTIQSDWRLDKETCRARWA
jgi:hypothetical protein